MVIENVGVVGGGKILYSLTTSFLIAEKLYSLKRDLRII